ncbi:MAG: alginate export family protein, partial [Pseudomonadota bacterium]
YLALRRANLSSPEVRLRLNPRDDFWIYAAYRPAWLASRSDRWPTAGVVDPTGNSGNFIGDQVEVRARWTVVPKQWKIEFGGALLFAGEFARTAPNSRGVDTTAFGYVQSVVNF